MNMLKAALATPNALRIALVLVAIGLAVQIVMVIWWTPLTFIISTGLGCGAIGLGVLFYLWAVWRAERTPRDRKEAS